MAKRTATLIQILLSGNEKAKVDAAFTLGERKAIQAEDALLDALNDESLEVKEWAAEALGKIKSVRAIAPLISLLKLDDFAIRIQVAWTLNKIGKDGIEALYQTIASEDSATRVGVATGLAYLGTDRAIEAVKTLLNDNNFEVRVAADDMLKRRRQN